MYTSVCLKALGSMTTGALLIHFVFCIAECNYHLHNLCF